MLGRFEYIKTPVLLPLDPYKEKKTEIARDDLSSGSEGNVELLEFVETSQHTGSSHSSQDVGSGSLHQGHESLVLHNLHKAVHGSLVLDSTSGGHHHAPPHGVDGVRHKPSRDGDSPSKEEGDANSGISSQKEWLEGVVETEVHTTVDEDTDSGDSESSVQALDTIGLQGLDVNIYKTIELTLAALSFGVISKPDINLCRRCPEVN